MTNAQKLEKLGMYEVCIKVAEASDICIIDTIQGNRRICPPGQDCRECIGAWLAEEVDHETRTEVQMQTDL